VKAQVDFGRRGGSTTGGKFSKVRDVSTVSAEPSGAYAEIARVARSAFHAPLSPLDAIEAAEPIVLEIDDEEAMRAYVGPNWGAYKRLWRRMREAPGFFPAFGLGPALFGGVWLIFRKLYVIGFSVVAIETTLAAYAVFYAPFAALIFRVLIGRYGKALVLIEGANAMARVVTEEPEPSARLYRLSKEGGVAWMTATLTLLALVATAGFEFRENSEFVGRALDAAAMLTRVRAALP
jgi:hypothetical protein